MNPVSQTPPTETPQPQPAKPQLDLSLYPPKVRKVIVEYSKLKATHRKQLTKQAEKEAPILNKIEKLREELEAVRKEGQLLQQKQTNEMRGVIASLTMEAMRHDLNGSAIIMKLAHL